MPETNKQLHLRQTKHVSVKTNHLNEALWVLSVNITVKLLTEHLKIVKSEFSEMQDKKSKLCFFSFFCGGNKTVLRYEYRDMNSEEKSWNSEM